MISPSLDVNAELLQGVLKVFHQGFKVLDLTSLAVLLSRESFSSHLTHFEVHLDSFIYLQIDLRLSLKSSEAC